jgi:hypothetical protein
MILRLRAQVEKVVGKKVVLLLEDGQRLSVEKDDLWPNDAPASIEQEPYSVEIMPEREAKLERDALARTLLNQLLSDQPAQPGSPHGQENASGK